MDILDLRKTDVSQQEIATYLSSFPTENKYSKDDWLKRLRFWWDLNPYYDDGVPRGWLLRDGERIRGFMGAIVGRFQGMTANGPISVPSLAATTWRVDEDARGESMQIFMKYLQCKRDYLLYDSTPTPAVEKVLQAFKFKGPFKTRNAVYPLLKPIGSLFHAKAVGRKLSTDDLRGLKMDFPAPLGFLQREISWEFLDWYCFKGLSEKHLYGIIENGKLQAYVIILKERFRGHDIVRVVDFAFQEPSQIDGLLGRIAKGAGEEFSAKLLVFTAFPDNPLHASIKMPLWTLDKSNQPHYEFSNAQTSRGLKWAPKLFDGDYGC